MAVAHPSALNRSRTVEIEAAEILPAHELEGQVLSGAQITCAALEAEGVDTVFGYPGGAVIPLYDAIPGSKLHHVLVRFEQWAALAAFALAVWRSALSFAENHFKKSNIAYSSWIDMQ